MRNDLKECFNPSDRGPFAYQDLSIISFTWLMAQLRNNELLDLDITAGSLNTASAIYRCSYLSSHNDHMLVLYNYFKATNESFDYKRVASDLGWSPPLITSSFDYTTFANLINAGVHYFTLRLIKTYWLMEHYAHIYTELNIYKNLQAYATLEDLTKWIDPVVYVDNPFVMGTFYALKDSVLQPLYGALLTVTPSIKLSVLFFNTTNSSKWFEPLEGNGQDIFRLKKYHMNHIPNKDWYVNAISID